MSDAWNRYSLADSPFRELLVEFFEELPVLLKLQYCLSDPKQKLVFRGQADEIHHSYRFLKPLFFLLAKSDILFPEDGENISAEMCIVQCGRKNNRNCYYWHRVFSFCKPRRFNAFMYYCSKSGEVIERLGPGGIFELSWSLEYTAPNTLTVRSERFYVCFLGRRLRLARCLTPSAIARERVRSASNQSDNSSDKTTDTNLEVQFSLRLPLLGEVFRFSGTFEGRLEDVALS